ncbi:MAG TPA: DNA polymerase III subunit delta' [Rhodanobacteraceae bacterium]|nr:DNA polymerase III subunit delta' [Rhodanobacteraceae bacterium]
MMLPPWLAPSWRMLADAIASGRMHHALLFASPRGFGKRALADAFAAALLCQQRDADGSACGKCRSCLLVAAGSHPDLVRVTFELRDDGRPRTELTVDQLRALGQRLSLASQFGGWQIALIDPADAMNPNAANALLKTLEEPSTNTLIALIADDPSRLPPTIRSRCRKVDLPMPTRAESLAWLTSRGMKADVAADMLDISMDNPGLAEAWLADGVLAVREECAKDLAGLGGGRQSANAVAERWAADRPVLRLWFAGRLALDEARMITSGGRGALGLTRRAEIPKLNAWFGRANQARGLLAMPVRADLVLLDLLRGWPARSTS